MTAVDAVEIKAMLEQPALIQLAKDYATNRGGRGIVFLIGSGLSSDAGIPTWKDLRAKLTKELERIMNVNKVSEHNYRSAWERLKAENDPWKAFTILKIALGSTTFNNRVAEFLSPSSEVVPENYLKLLKLDVLGFITLNIDELIVRAFAHLREKQPTAVYGKKQLEERISILTREKPFLYQPHGNIASPDSWVFTDADFCEINESAAHEQFLRATFLTNTVVFIGVSADDQGASLRLMDLRSRGILVQHHFWIAPDTSSDRRGWAEENGIQQILYPSRLGHSKCIGAIIDFLNKYKPQDELYTRAVVGQVNISKSPRENFLGPDDLFKLDNVDEIRMQLDGIIRSEINSAGEVAFDRYRKICKDYKRSIHAAYMLPQGEQGETWFGYELTGQALGGKTMGRVYPAVDGSGKKLAVKVLDQKRYSDDLYLSAFRRGISSLRILEKYGVEGIVDVVDAHEVPPTIVMEFLECASLLDVVEAKRIELRRAIDIIKKVCNIIVSAHMLPEIVLHRDVKPSNILLEGYDWSSGEYSSVKVIDFDLSWFKGAVGDDFIRSDRESLSFQAPEQFEGRTPAERRTTKVDSYGVGASLYYCISARVPAINAARENAWESEVRRVSEHACKATPEISQYLARTISRAMADKFEERTAVSEIRDSLTDIESWLSGESGEISPRFAVELVCALSTVAGYNVDDRERMFSYQLSNGARVTCTYNAYDSVMELELSYERPHSARNASVDVNLNKAREEVPKFLSKYAKDKPSFNYGVSRSFDSRAKIPIVVIQEKVREIAAGLRGLCTMLQA